MFDKNRSKLSRSRENVTRISLMKHEKMKTEKIYIISHFHGNFQGKKEKWIVWSQLQCRIWYGWCSRRKCVCVCVNISAPSNLIENYLRAFTFDSNTLYKFFIAQEDDWKMMNTHTWYLSCKSDCRCVNTSQWNLINKMCIIIYYKCL